MSNHRSRIDRSTAERLLRGESVGPDHLTGLLAATVPLVEGRELAGEEAAMAAFREARLAPASPLRRKSMIKTALAKLLTLKVAAVALTAAAAGGVMLAARTGHMPGPSAGAATTARPTPGHDSGRPSAAHGRHSGASASPSPSLAGLCHAYRAGAGANSGNAVENPAFTHLITVAGGKDKVAAYCAELLKTSAGKARASHPTSASTRQRKGATAKHRTGAPTTHLTGAPTRHPGAPSTQTSH